MPDQDRPENDRPGGQQPHDEQPTQALPDQGYSENYPTTALPDSPGAQPTEVLPESQPNPYSQQAQSGYSQPQGYPQQPQGGYPQAYGADQQGGAVPPAPPAGPYQGDPYGAPQPQQAPLNTLSLVSFIGSFFISLVGIICGHISLSQIKKSGERGRGFALAGTIIGYVVFGLQLIVLVVAIIFASMGIAFAGAASSALDDYDSSDGYTSEPTTPGEEDPWAEDDESSSDESTGSTDPALCDALDVLVEESSSFDPSSGEVPQGLVDAYEAAADAPGPNQDLYRQAADFLANPTADSSMEFMDMSSDLTDAMFDDYMNCY